MLTALSASAPQAPEQARQSRRASQAAHDKLAEKLVALGKLANLTSLQVNVASRERGSEAYTEPASNAQRWEALTLAGQLEAGLPDLAGSALHKAAQLVMFLLDPAGATRLAEDLCQARKLLAFWATPVPAIS